MVRTATETLNILKYFLVFLCPSHRGRDNSVGISTSYGLEGPRIESRWGRDFRRPSRPAVGPTHPTSYTMGTVSFPGVKMPGRGVDHPTHLALRLKKDVNKKVQLDATVCRHLFTAKSLYMFRASQHPSSGALKTVTATSGRYRS